jgi:hypothetical protein
MTVVGIVDDVSGVDLLQPKQPTVYAAWTRQPTSRFRWAPRAENGGRAGHRAAVAGGDRERGSDARGRSHSIGRDVFADSLAPQTFRTR